MKLRNVAPRLGQSLLNGIFSFIFVAQHSQRRPVQSIKLCPGSGFERYSRGAVVNSCQSKSPAVSFSLGLNGL